MRPFYLGICLLCMAYISYGQAKPWEAPAHTLHIQNPVPKSDQAIAEGKKLYNLQCALCHGDKGKGDGMAGIALKPRPASFTSSNFISQADGSIFWKIQTGRPPMAAYKDLLKEEEIWKIINYIRTLSKPSK